MTSETPAKVDGIPAATIVIFRKGRSGAEPEFLMVTRSRNMAFASGAAVFPGGRVDPEDFALARDLGCTDTEDGAHRIAALRETLEETGLAIGIAEPVDAAAAERARAMLLDEGALAPVLEAMGWTLDLEALVPFARWFPKNERLSRVFDTRFYLYDVGTGAVDVAVDETENTRVFWSSATATLEAADREELTVIFPTRRNLERLAEFADFDAAQRQCSEIPVRIVVPFMEERDGEPWICIDDDLGYPVTGERLETMQRG